MPDVPDLAPVSDPIAMFGEWFEAARRADVPMPEAMTLATASVDGVPSARMVLLKGFDRRGFTLFTNYGSRKSRELDTNPRAALCFHWVSMERQVRIEGTVTRVSAEESSEYFRTRPRSSRIGAWASEQSTPLADREILEARVRDLEKKFGDDDIPLPPFWGGYRVEPVRIEFWQGRPSRLHDRFVYTKTSGGWLVTRLYP
jgi:pyridoxamine 5'-phosphate oxidase